MADPITPSASRAAEPTEKKQDVKKSRIKAIWESLELDRSTMLMMFKWVRTVSMTIGLGLKKNLTNKRFYKQNSWILATKS